MVSKLLVPETLNPKFFFCIYLSDDVSFVRWKHLTVVLIEGHSTRQNVVTL